MRSSRRKRTLLELAMETRRRQGSEIGFTIERARRRITVQRSRVFLWCFAAALLVSVLGYSYFLLVTRS